MFTLLLIPFSRTCISLSFACQFKSADALDACPDLVYKPTMPLYPPAEFYPSKAAKAAADPVPSKARLQEQERVKSNFKFLFGGFALLVTAGLLLGGSKDEGATS